MLALVGSAGDPVGRNRLMAVAACDFTVAIVALVIPWEHTRAETPALLGIPSFAVLGYSTWAFGGVAAGTGPFLVLIYAWAGLHFPRWILHAYLLPAAVAYALPLVLTAQPPMVLSSAFVLLPIAWTIALLIEAQARHLRDDRERLARIEHWRSAMISTLAHDVRTPLATVQLALGELRGAVDGPYERMLDAALRQTGRISRLADSLLDVTRIDRLGNLKLDRRVLPAADLVRDALQDVRTTGVTCNIAEGLTLDVDKARFEQIIVNLIGNAMRYGRPPVVVTVTREGATDRLEVRDHGPGIPETLRPHLFSQFAVGGDEGVGLGLWIVRQLAEAHGGRITAEARSPGVAMVVTFPASAPVAQVSGG